jgi:hypothetical protein
MLGLDDGPERARVQQGRVRQIQDQVLVVRPGDLAELRDQRAEAAKVQFRFMSDHGRLRHR